MDNKDINKDSVKDSIKNAKIWICLCGKEYKYDSGYYRHKKKCTYIDPENEQIKEPEKEQIKELEKKTTDSIDYKNMFIKIIEENKDMKDLLIMQQKQAYVQQQQMVELVTSQQKQMSEIIPKIGNNNNTITTTNTTKNKFNLKIFLNETCKDAITMTEFINRFEISMQNIILLKDKGLIESVTQAFIENMNKLSITERPIHCTDKKRERLYIKNDTWELDEDNKQMKIILKKLNHKQLQSTEKWTDANPDFMTEDNLQDEFVKLIGNCTSSFEGKEDKIIRNICEHVYLNEKDNFK